MLKCHICGGSNFRFVDWQDERDQRNGTCQDCESNDKSDWVESTIYITFRHNPNELSADALAHNVLRCAIESDGFGEVIEIEVK